MSIQNELERTNAILDSIEDKIGGGSSGDVFVVNVQTGQNSNFVMDKTWQEIYDAFSSGISVRINQMLGADEEDGYMLFAVSFVGYDPQDDDPRYVVVVPGSSNNTFFETNTPSGYPTFSFG